tara:strand:+ start:128 stop:1030 length:903 start_codon:yes stop_codon:yes gene_type:complete
MKNIFLVFFSFLLLSCTTTDLEADQISENSWTTKSFIYEFEGLNRRYILHRPKDLKDNSPLIFILHGFGSSATNIMSYSQMNLIADQNGFLVCYPQGSTLPTGQSHWNANLEMSTVNDIDFLSELSNQLSITYKTNEENTFVAGMSNGGFMSYTLGCNKSNVFKAIASVTGTMSGKDWKNCSPVNKIPVLQISGTDDTTVPWDGSMSTSYGWGGAPHIKKVVEFWGDLNQCDQVEEFDFPDIDNSDKSTVSLTKRKGSSDGNEVWFYTVKGGGHDWPGSWGNKDMSASEEIWKFFKNHLK